MNRVLVFALALYCSACAVAVPVTATPTVDVRPTTQAERAAVIDWGRRMGKLLISLREQLDHADLMFTAFATARPGEVEVEAFAQVSAAVSDLYLAAVKMDAPEVAADTHSLFVDQLDRTADMFRLYEIGLRENDLAYYDQSVEAQQEAARIAKEATDSLSDLLDRYDLTCADISFCGTKK